MNYSFREATKSDADAVTGLVDAAYSHYVERLGMLPGPMNADYAQVIHDHSVSVAEADGTVVGVIVLSLTNEGFAIDNVAVHPSHWGRGLGRTLLTFAEGEAERAGFDSIYLFTHEKMVENQDLYSKRGYVEYDRRSFGDFSLVYMRKDLREISESAVIQGLTLPPTETTESKNDG